MFLRLTQAVAGAGQSLLSRGRQSAGGELIRGSDPGPRWWYRHEYGNVGLWAGKESASMGPCWRTAVRVTAIPGSWRIYIMMLRPGDWHQGAGRPGDWNQGAGAGSVTRSECSQMWDELGPGLMARPGLSSINDGNERSRGGKTHSGGIPALPAAPRRCCRNLPVLTKSVFFQPHLFSYEFQVQLIMIEKLHMNGWMAEEWMILIIGIKAKQLCSCFPVSEMEKMSLRPFMESFSIGWNTSQQGQ